MNAQASGGAPDTPMRVFSSGGGVQSTACLVLAAMREIDYPRFVLIHMGEDTENPPTLRYLEQVALPYAAQHGIQFDVIRRQWRKGGDETLYQVFMREESRSINIPVRMANGAPGRRNCTADFKIRVIARWLREQGATPALPAIVGMGISLDEFHRMKKHSPFPHYSYSYPLVEGRIDRQACLSLIRQAGLPTPPKSSCWFCPYHSPHWWDQLKEEQPELFEKACRLEEHLNRRRARLGKDEVYLHGPLPQGKGLQPLRLATRGALGRSRVPPGRADTQQPHLLPDDYTCDSGHCFT